MANPQVPAEASFPIPPPAGNLQVTDSRGFLTPMAWEFLQKLWAAIQGSNGLADLFLALQPSPGIMSAAVESQLAEAFMLLQPQAGRRPEQPIVRFYGSFPEAMAADEELFDVEMTGDEHFPAGLGRNLGKVSVAPDADVTFPITVNGTPVGTMNVASGALVATWTMAAPYNAARGDRLRFAGPTPANNALRRPSYTFVGTRS